jgi:hypothetical protein
MRFFNAAEVSLAEAEDIRLTSRTSQSNIVVIPLDARWFDVRRLTKEELGKFVERLLHEELKAGCRTTH